jgi:hypothetical protein
MYSIKSKEFFDGTFLSYEIDPSDESLKYYNKEIMLTHAEKIDFNIKPDNDLRYYLNNYAHRSEDFNKLNKDKYNILFSGCSTTFGDGLPEQFRWSKLAYDELKVDNKGPFQCISFLGGGADKIVGNILKYCNKFGNPDIIIVLLNDFTRHVTYDEADNQFLSKINLEYSKNPVSIPDNLNAYDFFIQTQNYIRILEIYCNANNIKLFIASIDSGTTIALSNVDLKNFKLLNLTDEINKNINNNNFPTKKTVPKKYHKYLIKARDNHHDGIINNFLIKNFFIEKIKGAEND